MSKSSSNHFLSYGGHRQSTASDINTGVDLLLEDEAGVTSLLAIWPPLSSDSSAHFMAHLDALTSLGNDQFLFDAPNAAGGTGTVTSSAASTSPGLLQAFAGPTFDTVAQQSGYYQIPPDCTEATGVSALVAATNGQIEIFARDIST